MDQNAPNRIVFLKKFQYQNSHSTPINLAATITLLQPSGAQMATEMQLVHCMHL